MVKPRNPIERRLDRLHDQWVEFAERPDARLLVWQLEPREAPMVQAFWERENDGEASKTPDMFLRFDLAFENPAAHGYMLRESLIAQYREATESMADDPEVDGSWQCPNAAHTDDDAQALVRALQSFQAHFGPHIDKLAVWLDPQHVADTRAYLHWLQRVLHLLPPQVRLFSADSKDAPAHEPLWKVEPARVVPVAADLDMDEAMVELSRKAGELDTPGGQFRHLQVKLGEAASAGDLPLMQHIAERATALASASGWPHLAASVQMMLAAGQLGAGHFLEAAQSYTQVYTFGGQAEAASEPAEGQDDIRKYGTRLRLQARLGQVGVLFQLTAYDQAAQAAMQASTVAEQLGDTRAQLDALRLASFAYELHGALEHAWAVGMNGMALVQQMDDETRQTSTAPYLAQGLLRLTAKSPSYEAHRDPLNQQFDKLLGPDWRESLAAAPAPDGAPGAE